MMCLRLRDRMAMTVLPVIFEQSLVFLTKENGGEICRKVAEASYEMADTMLTVRKLKKKVRI